jgi:hypothetical protein
VQDGINASKSNINNAKTNPLYDEMSTRQTYFRRASIGDRWFDRGAAEPSDVKSVFGDVLSLLSTATKPTRNPMRSVEPLEKYEYVAD